MERKNGFYGIPACASALLMLVLALGTRVAAEPAAGLVDARDYMSSVTQMMCQQGQKTRIVNIVFHGHSVVAGYFNSPSPHTFEAYPHLVHVGLTKQFPTAMINRIVTAKGGEPANVGAARFEKDVLIHHPDVVTIDYALNDRVFFPDPKRIRPAWVSMIEKAKAKGVKVILMTPTPDMRCKIDDPNDALNLHAEQIRQLAKEYHVGLCDSQAAFKEYLKNGGKLEDVMAGVNHINAKGHEMVAAELLKWFPAPTH